MKQKNIESEKAQVLANPLNLRFKEPAVPRRDRESGFRTCSEGLFIHIHVSDSIVERDCLCYSKTQGKFYCFYRALFGAGQNSFMIGFNDWKYASEYIGSHERSPNNSSSIKIFLQRLTKKNQIDAQLLEVFASEFKYMKNVLYRVANIVKFLATHGLALKGSEDKTCSRTNGNVLEIEFVSQYDLVLVEH